MTHSLTPRVFVSAASSDLRTARKVVNEALTRIECLPIEEAVFGTEYGPIREMLARRIESCQAVIHLVGRDYGGEPDPRTLPVGQPRRSWTQIEYDLAKEQNKKLYLLVCDDTFPFDPLVAPEPTDKSAVQLAHRQAVLADPRLWHTVRTLDELQRQIENLKVPLDEVRTELRQQQIRHRLMTGLATVAIVLVLGGVIYGVNQLGQKVEQKVGELPGKIEDAHQETVRQLTDPAALAETIRKQIHATAEAKIKSLRAEKGAWRKEEEIKQERDLALGRVDDLIKLIQVGLKEGASLVFQRATEILQKDGTDEALAYLENSRPLTLDTARRHADQVKSAQARADAEKEQRNKTLQALVLEAELWETKLQWQLALERREEVAELADDWIEARNNLGVLYLKLARFRMAESHLRATLKLASNPDEESAALNNLAIVLQETNRRREAEPLLRRALVLVEQFADIERPKVSGVLNNLAQLLKDTNRLAEAESLLRRALEIDEKYYPSDHTDIARDLNNLGQLLQDTNRLTEAESLMRRALDIDVQHYGAEHRNVSAALNNLAKLLKITNREAEAEPLIRRALTIDEHSYGPEHAHVARDLNILASLLQETDRLVEAELLIGRALALDTQLYGAHDPKVAVHMNILASLLQSTSRLGEAESLMRRALGIDEQSNGVEHPNVARSLNNLALLLRDDNRLLEAEPLLRRALAMDEEFYGPTHREVGIDLYNLAVLLQGTNRLAEREPLVRRALAIDLQFYGAEHTRVAIILHNLAALLQDTTRLAEAESLLRRVLVVVEQADGVEHPNVSAALSNLTQLLKKTNRLSEAEVLTRRSASILVGFSRRVGRTHPKLQVVLADYAHILQSLKLSDDEVSQRLKAVTTTVWPLPPIVPEVERLLGPAKPVADVLAGLDHQYKADGKPAVYFLKPDQPIAPHIDELLGRSKLDVPLNEPVVPHLEKLLGPAKSTEEVLETLDRRYREQNKPAIWFLPLSEPISPHLDELLGPLPTKSKG